MTNFFASDFHYDHANIAGPHLSRWKEGFRDFNSVYAMNREIINSVNDRVKPEDTLYFLGDWSFGPKENVGILRRELKVRNIVFIYGNHDSEVRNNEHLFTETHELLHRKFGKNLFVMCHYPIREWDKCHRGSIHLFGHVHHKLEAEGKSMDVGWCKWRRPLSEEEILAMMETKPILGHHF